MGPGFKGTSGADASGAGASGRLGTSGAGAPADRVPVDRVPGAPADRVPADRAPVDRERRDDVPGDRAAGGDRGPWDQVPGGGVPWDEVPADRVPGDGVPWDRVPADHVPGAEEPWDPVPGDRLSADQMPWDQAASDPVPHDDPWRGPETAPWEAAAGTAPPGEDHAAAVPDPRAPGVPTATRHGEPDGPDAAAPAGPEDDPVPETEPLGPRRVRVVFLGLVLALLLAVLEQLVTATALPAITGDLQGARTAPGRALGVTTAYFLATVVTLPVHAKLGDLHGRKGLFQFALVVFVAGSALAGWSRTMDQLVAFRALQGVGAGGLLAGAQAIVADLVPARRRGRFLGVTGAALGLATLAGPLLGGLVTEHVSWRWCFWAAVPLGLVALLLVGAALTPLRPAPRGRLDVLGALLLAAASTFLVLLASWGGTEYAWDSRVVLGLACGAAGTLLLFVVVENYAPEPIVPLRLLRDPTFVVSGLVGTAIGVALFVVAACLPVFFQLSGGSAPAGGSPLSGGADPAEAGLLVLPLAGGLVAACLLSGHLISRTGRYTVHPVLGGAVAVVGMWLLSRLEPDTPRLTHSVWQAVLGVGIGLVLPALVLAVQNAAPPGALGTATGAHTLVRWIGGCAGVAALGAHFAHRLDHALAGRLPAGAAGTDLPGPWSVTPHAVRAMPPALRDAYLGAYAETMPRTLLHLVPVLGLGLLVAFFLKEKPLVTQNASTASVPPPRTEPGPRPEARPEARRGVPVCGTVQHHDGTCVPRAALTLIDAHGQQVGRGATGEDGRYALSVPGGGSYVMIAAAGGHQPQAVPVTVGERPVEIDVVLGGAGRLTGAVRTADGTPVRDATVTLTDVRGEVVANTRTGRDGDYVLTALVAGEYTLAASAPAFRPAALPVSVQAARETRQDIELAGGAVLRGTVRAPGGRPVEDARVTLLDAAGNVVDTLTTGPDGTFRFLDLSAGEYTVIAAGYPPVATVLRVTGGGRTERDLRLGHED
ncbi:MFS transporter [Streptomyces sp. NPDC049837]|uniref:MFS transporter n=1 Tax=Streptomyces sp. NPDC049837 TaxID=3155277 RepID=UPI0034170AA7